MNQIVQEAEIVSAVPIPMTRKEKLLHWATAIRRTVTNHPLIIFHRLEYWNEEMLRRPIDGGHLPIGYPKSSNAFGIAASDPTFQTQGYKGETVREAMNFFELSQQQLHEFSCDCGGAISKDEMANRIERLA